MLCCKNRVFLWSSRCRLRQHLRHLHLCFLRSSFFCSLAISSAVRVGSCAGWKKPTINLNLQAYRMRSKNMAWHKLKISSSQRYKDYPQMVPFVYVCVCLGGFASLAFLFKGQKRSKMVKMVKTCQNGQCGAWKSDSSYLWDWTGWTWSHEIHDLYQIRDTPESTQFWDSRTELGSYTPRASGLNFEVDWIWCDLIWCFLMVSLPPFWARPWSIPGRHLGAHRKTATLN